MPNTFLITLLCALVIVALMMLGLGIKRVFRKQGEFKRPCSNTDPYTGKSEGCICKQADKTKCSNATRYSPLEVNDNLLEEMRQ